MNIFFHFLILLQVVKRLRNILNWKVKKILIKLLLKYAWSPLMLHSLEHLQMTKLNVSNVDNFFEMSLVWKIKLILTPINLMKIAGMILTCTKMILVHQDQHSPELRRYSWAKYVAGLIARIIYACWGICRE